MNASASSTLVFSYLSQEVSVGNKSTVDVALIGDSKQLSEVVVIGYGTQQRQRVTSAISTINGNALANLATPSFDQ